MNFSLAIIFASLTLISSSPTSVSSNGYIIKFKHPAGQTNVKAFAKTFKARPGMLTESASNVIEHTYNPSVFNGIAGKFTKEFLAQLEKEHAGDIEYIERDGRMHAYGSQKSPPSWGLTRVSERKLDLSQPFLYPDAAGKGVEVYVIDTGIQANHTDFGGRAKMLKSFVTGEEATDLNGHGTHVAGTIASKTYGIAKAVTIYGVKVLDADGSGSFSDVIAGIDLVATETKTKKKLTVVNMSLGGGKSQAVDDAVNAAVAAGVVMIVAAGNESSDACDSSPSGASEVFAVGASDNSDTFADFSNTGKCVKIIAPGVDIKSLWLGADSATNTISGTSMATPHVVGVAALLMSTKAYTKPADVYAALTAAGTKNTVKNVTADTVNLLLYDNGAKTSKRPARR